MADVQTVPASASYLARPLKESPLKTGGELPELGCSLLSRVTPSTRASRWRHRREQPLHHSVASAAAVGYEPIWLGSATSEEVVHVVDILELVPPEQHQDEIVVAIACLEREAAQHEANRTYVMAAECLGQAVALRRQLLGGHHAQTLSATERVICCCSFWGMEFLTVGRHTSALEMLKTAEVLSEPEHAEGMARRSTLRTTAFCNLACYFKVRGKLNAALQFAEKSLRHEQRCRSADQPARLHLNYAVLLSLADRHSESIEQIEQGVAILVDEERIIVDQQRYGGTGVCEAKVAETMQQDVVSWQVIAMYNLWIEQCSLGRHKEAADTILRAANTAKWKLGASHRLTARVEQCLSSTRQEQMRATHSPPLPQLRLSDGEASQDDGAAMIAAAADPHLPKLVDARGISLWKGLRPRENAVDTLVETRQITARFVERRPKPPQRPRGKAIPLGRSLRQMRVHEHFFGRATHPIPNQATHRFFEGVRPEPILPPTAGSGVAAEVEPVSAADPSTDEAVGGNPSSEAAEGDSVENPEANLIAGEEGLGEFGAPLDRVVQADAGCSDDQGLVPASDVEELPEEPDVAAEDDILRAAMEEAHEDGDMQKDKLVAVDDPTSKAEPNAHLEAPIAANSSDAAKPL